MAELEKSKQELLKNWPEKEAKEATNLFNKFATNTTDDEKFEGFVSFNWHLQIAINKWLENNFIFNHN